MRGAAAVSTAPACGPALVVAAPASCMSIGSFLTDWPRTLHPARLGVQSGDSGTNCTVDERSVLLAEIAAEMHETAHWTGRATLSPRVAAALAKVRREAFVAPGSEDAAYENRPLPIGHGQTISQPFIVALMTELLDLEPEHTILEIGTGSGYQAAVLSELARSVCSIEVIPSSRPARRPSLRDKGATTSNCAPVMAVSAAGARTI